LDGPAGSNTPGILYAEDFGLDRVNNPPPPAPIVAPAPPSLTQGDVDAACIRAVQAAESAWSGRAEHQRAAALATLASGMAEVREQAEALAESVARTALSLLAAALPDLCRAHGDAEVRALLARMLPMIAPSTRLIVRVHPGLIDTLRADIAAVDDSLVSQIEFRSANLPPGDVRLAWDDGRLARDTAAICASLQDGLATLGLLIPSPPVTLTGSLEHAQ
jgi:hypothetical protein